MNDKASSAQSGGVSYTDGAQDNKAITGGVDGDAFFRDKFIYEAQPITVASLHQVPPPPRDFTGRAAEISELLEALEHGGVTISGLHGLGGVGKTTLALKLAELLEGRYRDAQFYLDLKGPSAQPTPAADALAHVIRAYHPTVKLPESVDDLRALYLSVLHGQRALLLMDNARDEHQVEPLIPPPGCLLMVTSRFHFTVPGLKVKNLDALLPEDAVKLLLEIAPRIGSEAAEIARLCGNLPLGLRVAASFLAKRPNFKVAECVRKLRETREWLQPVEASLNLSYELLREELQANWRALSVFPDSFDQRAAAAIWQLDEDQTQERLGELLSFSLVEWSEETDRYRLHDLARVFADSRLTEAERLTHQQRHAEHYLQVLKEAEVLYEQGGEAIKAGLALFDREWSNAQTSWEWAKLHANTISRVLELCCEYPNGYSYIAQLRQHPREQIAWRNVGLSAAEKLRWKEAQAAHLGNLGIAYRDLGEPRRAIEIYEQGIAIIREIGHRRGEVTALNSLGAAYADLGETQRAIEFYEQSLAVSREFGDRRGEVPSLGNLGIAYAALGETQRAIEFYEQSLAVAREIGYRRDEGNVLNNLGTAYSSLGETRRAIELYEQGIAICRELGDRIGEDRMHGNLGNAYVELGEFRRVIEVYEQLLDIRRELGDRKGEGRTLGNLGNAYSSLGEAKRAIEFYEQSLSITREVGDRRGEGHTLWNIAMALDQLGDRAQAIASAEAALVIFEQIEDPSAVMVREQLEEWRSE